MPAGLVTAALAVVATVLLHVAAGQLTTLAGHGNAAVTCDGSIIARPANAEPAGPPSTAVQKTGQTPGTSVVFICAKGLKGGSARLVVLT